MHIRLTLENLRRETEQYRYIVLYGAGKIGKQAFDLLKSIGINPQAFLVSSCSERDATVKGVPVYTVAAFPFSREETVVLLTAAPHAYDAMEQELLAQGYPNFQPLTEGISDSYFCTSGILEITTKIGCPVACSFCPQNLLIESYYCGNPSRESKLTFERFCACIETVPKSVQIIFSGMSEPWLVDECTDMVCYAAQRGHAVSVYTTLRGMKAEDVEKLQDIHFQDFVLHLPDAQENAKIPVTLQYLDVLQKIMYLHNIKGGLITGYSCHGTIHPEIAMLVPYKGDGRQQMQDRAGNLEHQQVTHRCHSDARVCIRSQNHLNQNILLPDGSVTLCCMDYSLRHILGNLTKDTYHDLFLGETIQAVREGLSTGQQGTLCAACLEAVPETFFKKWYVQ